ncbi:hypothetical protein ELH15_08935 [Rhizobium ruizarguesonis]|uniref:hypothetical protein n=1 Tax=Rhizobium ruizarguesonis TaxID=2081791 RepID=UPI0010326B06|nr:hypothetical protein [Rhizobium ruizarguesonis]TBD58674.1 hypothetical protein ELH15_08935 [Rhizobium ruizarguesonis]
MQTNFLREALYEIVWTTPVKTVAAEHNISDVAFAKTCKQHQIPLPPRGHWAKLEAGKKVRRQPLPERALGMPREVSFGASRWDYYGSAPKNLMELELIPPRPFDEALSAVRDKVTKRVKRISVPRDLSRAHPVVRKLLEADAPRRAKYWAATYKSLYDAPYFDSPFEQRRLRALNSLFLCLEQNDARVTSSGKNPHEFYARVGLTDVVISIDDPKVERTSWHATSDIAKSASGMLAVMINRGSLTEEFQSTWQDKPNDKIESHLTEIAVNVLVAGESACRSKELAHYEWLVRRKADLIERSRIEREKAEQAERERRVKEEQSRVDRLLSEAKALREAQEIRAYVASVKALNETSHEPILETDIASWASWALEQADRIDPIRSRRFLSDQA